MELSWSHFPKVDGSKRACLLLANNSIITHSNLAIPLDQWQWLFQVVQIVLLTRRRDDGSTFYSTHTLSFHPTISISDITTQWMLSMPFYICRVDALCCNLLSVSSNCFNIPEYVAICQADSAFFSLWLTVKTSKWCLSWKMKGKLSSRAHNLTSPLNSLYLTGILLTLLHWDKQMTKVAI